MKLFKYLSVAFLLSIFFACSNNNYTVAKSKVGSLDKTTKIKELTRIFAKDSLVSNLSESDLGNETNNFKSENDEYFVYSKEGSMLLKIVPHDSHDPESTIQFVQVFDPKFKTTKNINIYSTFKEVHSQYTIDNIETSLSSALLYINELNVTLALDKKDLGFNAMQGKKVTLEQIPDFTKIKYFTVWFN